MTEDTIGDCGDDRDQLRNVLALDDRLSFALYSASHAMVRAYRSFLGPLGLTYPQYVTLLVIWEEGRLNVSQLGDRLRLDSGTLTPVLKRMEGSGLLDRSRSRVDERQVEVTLTEQGAALRSTAIGISKTVGGRLGMSIEEMHGLRRQLDAMVAHLDAAADGSKDGSASPTTSSLTGE